MPTHRRLALSALVIGLASSPAAADAAPPSFSIAARETADLWDELAGSVNTGAVMLNKFQISASVSRPFGLPGLSAHAQVFRTDGHSLSAHVGDIQTVSNIEALTTTRLFESWVEQRFGDDRASFAVRAGLMDLNADFDALDTPTLFINSSHGIGPDISRSGVNGPSIFPVSSLGLRLSWLPSQKWTFRVAAFDGVAGDPDRPKAFVAVRLARRDGALLIAEADYHLSDAATVAAGAWGYTADQVLASGFAPHRDRGFYASIEGPIPGQTIWRAWARAGVADGDAQIVRSYLGLGLVGQGVWRSRPDDRIGLAVAHAGIGRPARAAFGLGRAETNFEASYQYRLRNTLAVQPDVQYILHPEGAPHAANALVLGLRLILTAGYPHQSPATDSADPTVAPEGPQPPAAPAT